jgi:hypothetical protein
MLLLASARRIKQRVCIFDAAPELAAVMFELIDEVAPFKMSPRLRELFSVLPDYSLG